MRAESSPRTCSICERPLKGEASECSVGCAVAAKIPLGETDLPASWPLFGVLASGFVFFNQLLFWSVSAVKRSQGLLEDAWPFELTSLAVGGVWLLSAAGVWSMTRPKTWGDGLIGLVAVLILLSAAFPFSATPSFSTLLAVANLLVAFRLYRGVIVLWRSSKKKEK